MLLYTRPYPYLTAMQFHFTVYIQRTVYIRTIGYILRSQPQPKAKSKSERMWMWIIAYSSSTGWKRARLFVEQRLNNIKMKWIRKIHFPRKNHWCQNKWRRKKLITFQFFINNFVVFCLPSNNIILIYIIIYLKRKHMEAAGGERYEDQKWLPLCCL